MKRNPKPKFSDWLQQSLRVLGQHPRLWVSYSVIVAALLLIGHISQALGIFVAVASLFVGVGLAKYTDLQQSAETKPSLNWVINKSLPLALIAALIILLCWFVFLVTASLMSGEVYKIAQFFFHWEYTDSKLLHARTRDLAVWLYSYADVALIFSVLMLSSFVGWFTHPLMLFRNETFSHAKEKNDYATSRNQKAIYQLLAFIIFQALLCSTLTPLLTPVLYALVSVLIYMPYKSLE